MLTQADLAGAQRTLRTLLGPLEHDSLEQWAIECCRELDRLLGAERSGFLVPLTSGPRLFGLTWPRHLLQLYVERHYAHTPPELRRRARGYDAWVREQVWPPREWSGSEYYHEFIVPTRHFDSAAMATSLAGGQEAVFYASRSRIGAFAVEGREQALLRLVQPGFAAGVRMVLLAERQRQAFLATLDTLSLPVLVSDADGRPLHRTPSLVAACLADAEGQAVVAGAEALAREVARVVRRARRGPPPSPERTVTTRLGRYVLRGVLQQRGAPGGRPIVLVTVEPPQIVARPSVPDLMSRFRLTRREAEVACALAEGLRNRDLAERLGITESTARRHTEAVLRKLDVRSRAAVARRLMTLEQET